MRTTGTHPDFRDPPVVETVLGFQFTPIAGFTPIHAGLFWQRIKGDFPKAELKEPLLSAPAKFAGLESLPFRSWFLSASGEYLVQIQADRFLVNWRKQQGSNYPSYAAIKPRFADYWARWVEFLADERFGRPIVQLCQVSYVNHIETAGNPVGLSSLYRFWSGGPTDWLLESSVEGFTALVHMPDQAGQVQVQSASAIRLADAKEVLQLTFNSSRPVSSQSDAGMLEDLDKVHDLSIRAFLEFTSEELQDSWGRASG